MDKLKSSIEEANLAVDKEREKNVSLLHMIFPPNIAKRLWLGKHVVFFPPLYERRSLASRQTASFPRLVCTYYRVGPHVTDSVPRENVIFGRRKRNPPDRYRRTFHDDPLPAVFVYVRILDSAQ